MIIKIKLLILLLLSFLSAKSNGNERLSICTGIGNYESIFCGVGYKIKRGNTINLTVGQNLNFSNNRYFAITIEEKKEIFQSEKLPISLHSKIIYWELSDEYFNWGILALNTALGYTKKIRNIFFIEISLGPVLNIQLNSEHKNYNRAGWQKIIDWNSTLKFGYYLNSRKK